MKFRLLPESAGAEAGLLIAARGLRAFADGLISLVLPAYLAVLGFDAFAIGVIATATLLGSSVFTLAMGRAARRFPARALLIFAALWMTSSGLAFISVEELWPLAMLAFVGTLNPSAGEASIFLPLEQARLSHSVTDRDRTSLFARYSFIGALCAAFGALAATVPELMSRTASIELLWALKGAFVLYALLGLIASFLYSRLKRGQSELRDVRQEPLGKSRRTVYVLTALFSLDAFGGGFVVQSLLALWLFQRFGLDLATAGAVFFWIGIFSALSFLAAPWLARRVGLVNTMVFTHLPASICLALVPLMPTLGWAVFLLLARSALSQLDVPTRTSYVMAVVTPPERAAAASLTIVPRSLAAAASPAIAGALLTATSFGWPLVIGGGLKVVYDLLLLWQFRNIRPSEELPSVPVAPSSTAAADAGQPTSSS